MPTLLIAGLKAGDEHERSYIKEAGFLSRVMHKTTQRNHGIASESLLFYLGQ